MSCGEWTNALNELGISADLHAKSTLEEKLRSVVEAAEAEERRKWTEIIDCFIETAEIRAARHAEAGSELGHKVSLKVAEEFRTLSSAMNSSKFREHQNWPGIELPLIESNHE